MLLGIVSLVLAAGFVLAWTGAIGPLVVCGADQAAVCVAWPGIASWAVWGSYILFFLGMAAWHVWMWRHEAPDAASDDAAARPGETGGEIAARPREEPRGA